MEGLPSPVPAFSVRILDVSFWRPSGFFAKRSLCTLEIFFTLLTACVVEWASYYGTAIWISCRSIVEVSVQAYLGAQSGVGPPEGEKNEKLFGTRWADSHDGYDISCNLKNFCAQHKSQHRTWLCFITSIRTTWTIQVTTNGWSILNSIVTRRMPGEVGTLTIR